MGRKKVKNATTNTTSKNTNASHSTIVEYDTQSSDTVSDTHNASSALSYMFAQSAKYFMKKESYISKTNTETEITESNVIETIEEELPETGVSKSIKNNTKQAKLSISTNKNMIKETNTNKNEQADVSKEPVTEIKKRKRRKSADEENNEKSEHANANAESNTVNDINQDKSFRTIFVGNVSIEATSKAIKSFFSSCGKVESVRLRSLPIAGCKIDQSGNQNLMKKVCANKKILKSTSEGGRNTCNAYVTFVTKESFRKAIKEMHGKEFMGRKLRVDSETLSIDPRRTIYVGNLPFNLDDDELWNFFELKLSEEDNDGAIDEKTGKPKQKKAKKRKLKNLVENMRIIRDNETGKTQGFGYVLLKNPTIAGKALRLNGSKFQRRRALRIENLW